MTPSLPAEYFAGLYAANDDPWRISDGWYEDRKRTLLLDSLSRPHYPVVFEPGCSNGELTARLAGRCDRLVAWDVAEAAVERARARTGRLPGVEIRQAGLPDEWPDEQADLIVFAEVGYYLDGPDLNQAIGQALDRLAPTGELLALHWRHDAPDYPLGGDQVHQLINAHERLNRVIAYQDADFLLDIWTDGPAPSIAQEAGLL